MGTKATEDFEVKWEALDGYVGGTRPQSFTFSQEEIEDDMCIEEIVELMEEAADEDFNNKCQQSIKNKENFVRWAEEVLARKRA